MHVTVILHKINSESHTVAEIPKMSSAATSSVTNNNTHFSDTDSDSSSSSSPTRHGHADLSNSIFKSYNHQPSDSSTTDLTKIQTLLTTSSSGALSCLICLERIKPSDPTWQCQSLCYALFHLICIQSWSRQSTSLSASRAAALLPISPSRATETSTWNCPKCRSPYAHSQIPKSYFCFCGKLENPPSDNPWILPHSCGEICDRPLRNECGHFCLLLCHPGPCPPCPQLVKSSCFCGRIEDVRRCGNKLFSCNYVCNKLLDCKKHNCVKKCHDGECPPCQMRGVYKCLCGKEEMERECSEREFRCENECGKRLGCGKHLCQRGCHEGECGGCPYQGKRSCPCGKRIHDGMDCDVMVPLCGATCNKVLSCGLHRCPERCHRGECNQTCIIVLTKLCRCGGLKKQVPCYQDLACERKCQRMRDCGRHACRRRCCDGNCPPCGEVCDKRLRCRNHKCPAPCHQGHCAPCPLMVRISCACGQTHFEVPCGTEKDQKPPRCRKLCGIPRLCRHAAISKPHKCHYGACPPCKLLCEEEYPCGHHCKLSCHGSRPPPNPEFTLKPKKKKGNHQSEPTAGSQCPPCPELVWRSCVGRHIGAERMMVCSDKTQFACDNLCDNPLPCGNHYCTKTCHSLKSEPCEVCNLPCEKERNPTCPHPCPRRCHPGDCLICKVLVKRACHCGAMVHVFECHYYNTLPGEEQVSVRSCSGPCHRKLPNCTHLCPEICHPDQCPSPENCSKKVTVRCQCQNLKKEWICQDVQAAYRKAGSDPKEVPKNHFGVGLLPCNNDCKSKKIQVVDAKLHLRKTQVVEEKDPDSEKHVSKRRKRHQRVQETKQVSKFQGIATILKRLLLAVILVMAVVASAYLGYKGLIWLSDWMNEVEEKRERQRYPRF